MFLSLNIDRKIRNDIYLATCFLLLYTANFTQSHIQKTLTVSMENDDSEYVVNGYVSLGIIFGSTAVATWFGPCVMTALGMKLTMVVGAICVIPFVTTCYIENILYTYLSSTINGIGSAIIWVGQAEYTVLNSEIGLIYESIGMFWIFYKCSYILGDAFVFLEFNDSDKHIDRAMRARITLVLLAFVVSSVIMFCLLPSPQRKEIRKGKSNSMFSEIRKCYSIFNFRQLIVLGELFLYIGLHVSFLSIVASSIGFSEYLSANSKKYAPLSGVLQGFGEIAGSCWCLYLKNKSNSPLGRIIFVTGSVANLVAYIIFLLGLPNDSVFDYTQQLPILPLPISLVFLANVLIGLGDSCIQIEAYQCIGYLFPNDGGSAFAILNCFAWITMAAGFFSSTGLGLHYQMTILIVSLLLTVIVQYFSYTRNFMSSENTESILHDNAVMQRTVNYEATERRNKTENPVPQY